MTMQQQLEQTFRRALSPAKVAAAEPSTDGPLAGRSRDTSSFLLAAGRIRPDAAQVRRLGKDLADPELIELAASIREHGVQQPLQVRWLPDEDLYQLVSGERRYLAATRIVGLAELPVRVIERGPEELLVLQLTENLQRADLHPLDLADGVAALVERGLTLTQVAAKLAKSLPYIQKTYTLATRLTPAARAEAAGVPSLDVLYDVARAPAGEQAELVRRITRDNLSRRQVRAAASPPAKTGRTGRPARSKPFTLHIAVAGGAVTVRFRKVKAGGGEVAAALREALGKVMGAEAA